MRWFFILASIILLIPVAHAETVPEKRVALVVGNGSYQNAAALKNPVNDADAMSKALKAIGFDVIEVKNATKQQLERSVGEFGRKLACGGIGLFFYSGHGMQVNGKNFLIPVDAELANEGALRIETTDVDLVLDQMAVAQTSVNLVILDACRNNPFERRFRSISGGLAAMNDAPKGTIIAYATSPGKIASDGSGANGAYTKALLGAITMPGLSVEDVFKRVRMAVETETNDSQTPWETSSLTGTFYFVPPKAGGNSPHFEPPISTTDPAAVELAYWQSVSNSGDIKAYHSYLKRYPNGQFADLAKLNISKLETAAKQPPAPLPVANIRAISSKGDAAFDRNDYTEAMRWYRMAADQGDRYSQTMVGKFFRNGKGVSKDVQQAMYWYRKAADQGDANAQEAVGKMYVDGVGGIPIDLQQAMYWCRKAADQGLKNAQYLVGFLYTFGEGGISQDYSQAMYWYRKAADQGFAMAQGAIGILYYLGHGVTVDYSQAMYWSRKAADQGDVNGQNTVGALFEKGLGVSKDIGQARYWFGLAAQRGYPPAQEGLARLGNQ